MSHQSAAMETIDELRALIKAAICPWKSSSVKPPFSDLTLVTMALAHHHPPVPFEKVRAWVQHNFSFYEQGNYYDTAGIMQALYSYNAPVRRCSGYTYTLCVNEARIYLQHVLRPELNDFPRFLDLPPELRTTIYEMVLQYPLSGLLLDARKSRSGGQVAFTTVSRERSTPSSVAAWTGSVPLLPLFYQLVPEALSLLLVNKQIFNETLPIFYGSNIFYFDHLRDAYDMLRRLPESRREHVKQLALCYRPNLKDFEAEDRTFKLIASFSGLRTLHIDVPEAERWIKSKNEVYIERIRALTRLRELTTAEVVFTGCLSTLAQHLNPKMKGASDVREQVDGGRD